MTGTACVIKLNSARARVMKIFLHKPSQLWWLHLSKKNNPLLKYTVYLQTSGDFFFRKHYFEFCLTWSMIKQKRRCVHPDEKYSWWRGPREVCEFFHAHFSNKIKFLFINRFSLCYSRSTLHVLFSCFIFIGQIRHSLYSKLERVY